MRAGIPATVTDRLVATTADFDLAGHEFVASMAGDGVPFLQWGVRPVDVVGMQDAIDDVEEVGEATRFESPLNRHCRITFTEPRPRDVRVGDLTARDGIAGRYSRDGVRVGFDVEDLAPFQLDAKRS